MTTRSMTCLMLLVCTYVTSAAAEKAGDLFMLSIGVEPDKLAKGKLDLYSRDAVHVRKAFVNAEPGFETVKSRLLNGPNATPTNVLDGLSWIGREMTPQDTAVIFFSTHGDLEEGTKFYFTLAPEADGKKTSWLYATRFNDALKALKGKVIVLADTCHAEGIISERKTHDASIIAASTLVESSSGQYGDAQSPHGFFVIALCEGLQGLADSDGNRIVTLAELGSYIALRSHALNSKQTAVVRLQPLHEEMALSRVDGRSNDVLRVAATKPRNPFGCVDVIQSGRRSVERLVRQTRHERTDQDPNALEWNSKLVRGDATGIDGEWEGRWRGGDETEWSEGTVWIKTVNNRIYLIHKEMQTDYLMELERIDGDRIAGHYMNLSAHEDGGAWVGFIASPQRIDGFWSNGRWDFRRRIRNGDPE